MNWVWGHSQAKHAARLVLLAIADRAQDDGSAWIEENCDKHVSRGGSLDRLPIFIRSSARSGSGLSGGDYDYSTLAGFRVARDLP